MDVKSEPVRQNFHPPTPRPRPTHVAHHCAARSQYQPPSTSRSESTVIQNSRVSGRVPGRYFVVVCKHIHALCNPYIGNAKVRCVSISRISTTSAREQPSCSMSCSTGRTGCRGVAGAPSAAPPGLPSCRPDAAPDAAPWRAAQPPPTPAGPLLHPLAVGPQQEKKGGEADQAAPPPPPHSPPSLS